MVRRQFTTPPSLPGSTATRCLTVPDSKEWWGIFNDVLLEAAQAYNYEQVNDTDMSPEDVAAICYQIYVDYLMGDCGVNCTDVTACLYPVGRLQRMNPTTGRYEVSDDGGETWQDASAQDPRFVSPRNEQATGYDCDDAKAVVGFVQEMAAQAAAQLDVDSSVLAMFAVFVGILATVFSFGAAGPVVLALTSALAGLTGSALTAALTAAVWERFMCNVYCTIAGEDEVTTDMFDVILATIQEDETGIAETFLWNAVNNLGPVGLHNAVTLGIVPAGVPADCDDCVCGEFCTQMNFASSQWGWVAGLYGIAWSARYVAGSGWGTEAGREVINVGYDLGADTHLTHIKMNVTGTGGPSVGYDGVSFIFHKDGVQVGILTNSDTQNNWNVDQAIDVVADQVFFVGNVSLAAGGSYLNYRLTYLEISGDGASPFEGVDCP